MTHAGSPIANKEPDHDTRFCKALRARVRNPEEALSIAITHRRRAAEGRSDKPALITDFLDWSGSVSLECKAIQHEQIAAACEQHAASLQNNGGEQ